MTKGTVHTSRPHNHTYTHTCMHACILVLMQTQISHLVEDAGVQQGRVERLETALKTAQQFIRGKARPHEQGLEYKQPQAQQVCLCV